MRWRRESPGEGEDEQQANLDAAAEQAGRERRTRGQTHRRTEKEREAARTEQPPDRP